MSRTPALVSSLLTSAVLVVGASEVGRGEYWNAVTTADLVTVWLNSAIFALVGVTLLFLAAAYARAPHRWARALPCGVGGVSGLLLAVENVAEDALHQAWTSSGFAYNLLLLTLLLGLLAGSLIMIALAGSRLVGLGLAVVISALLFPAVTGWSEVTQSIVEALAFLILAGAISVQRPPRQTTTDAMRHPPRVQA